MSWNNIKQKIWPCLSYKLKTWLKRCNLLLVKCYILGKGVFCHHAIWKPISWHCFLVSSLTIVLGSGHGGRREDEAKYHIKNEELRIMQIWNKVLLPQVACCIVTKTKNIARIIENTVNCFSYTYLRQCWSINLCSIQVPH